VRVSIPDTVVSGMARISAIWVPVKRSRRRAQIAATRSVGVRLWTRRGAEERSKEAGLALGHVAGDPLAGGRLADFGGLGRLRQRPTLLDDALGQQPALVQAERGVSVKLHPVTSLSRVG
jgi:hypothetical protein